MIKSSIYRGFLALTILLPVPEVMSEDISFDYVQADYISDTVDPGGSIDDVKGDGIGFSLSLSFAPAFAMTLAVAATTFETFQGMSVDTSKTTTLGVTAHTSIAQGTDIFANFSAVKTEITVTDGIDSTTDSDFGGVIHIGLRHLITDRFEVELGASHMNVFDYGVNLYAIDARFYIRKRLSVGMGYATSDDLDSLLLNVRMDI